MSTITNPRHLSLTAPLTIAITDVERPIRFSPAVQAIINRCGPQPAIGGRYAAWVHGLLPQPGAMVVFQAVRRAIPVSCHPAVQIRHDHLGRRARARNQLVSLLDAAADMVAFAHTPEEAASVAHRFIEAGGDASALHAAITCRPGRVHERAMTDALTSTATAQPDQG